MEVEDIVVVEGIGDAAAKGEVVEDASSFQLGAYGEPYAPLPGRNIDGRICAVASVVG